MLNFKFVLIILASSLLLIGCFKQEVTEQVTTDITSYQQIADNYFEETASISTVEELRTIIENYEELLSQIEEESKAYIDSELDYMAYEKLLVEVRNQKLLVSNGKKVLEAQLEYEALKTEIETITFDYTQYYSDELLNSLTQRLTAFENQFTTLSTDVEVLMTLSARELSEYYSGQLTSLSEEVATLKETNETLASSVKAYKNDKKEKHLTQTIDTPEKASAYYETYWQDQNVKVDELEAGHAYQFVATATEDGHFLIEDIVVDELGKPLTNSIIRHIVTLEGTIYQTGGINQAGSCEYSLSQEICEIPVADLDEAVAVLTSSNDYNNFLNAYEDVRDNIVLRVMSSSNMSEYLAETYELSAIIKREDRPMDETLARYQIDWMGNIYLENFLNGEYELVEK